MIHEPLIVTTGPAHPAGALGAATFRAADLVDRSAIRLLSACAPYDAPAANRARLESFLASWPEVELAVRQLAALVEAERIPAPANDPAAARASA